jgi:uncharacterized protein YndB with AHSA1/START domain
MARYRFLTAWCLAAPREDVFAVLHDSERWPEWWRGVERVVKLEPGDEEGRGSLGRYTWRSVLPYRLDFDMRITRVDRPHRMEGEAVGELSGTGRWRLYEDAGTTAVLYEWDVETTRAWMNALAPLARPVFRWNHDWVMRQGGEGLARRLGVELLMGS